MATPSSATEPNGKNSFDEPSVNEPQEMDGGPVPQAAEQSPVEVPAAPVSKPATPVVEKPAVDTAALDRVLYSDIGINTLLTRLKQSIASAKVCLLFLYLLQYRVA